MRLLRAAGLLVVVSGVVAVGCSSGGRGGGTGPGMIGAPGTDGGSHVGGDSDASAGDGAISNFSGCGSATYEAKYSPAAMMIALDTSGTMASRGKYANAQQAIISAIDQPAFDSIALGLLGFPTSDTPAPACLFGLVDTVRCGVSGLPQVSLAVAGSNLSSASSGVRHDIYSWLTNNAPVPGNGDGNPTYAALESSYAALRAFPLSGRRIAFYITDGGASCTSVSSRTGLTDVNGCADWEDPNAIVSLIQKAHDDAATPINTIVIGVPGADTTGSDPTSQPPYHVRNALSAYAYAGSPETVDPSCTGKSYSQAGADPAVSCHFDMSNNYSASALTSAIEQIRGKLLGCVFDLPTPTSGTLDPNQVNVQYDVGGMNTVLKRRADPSNMCTATGCWDYTADGRVELFGKACSDVKSAPGAQVEIVVGCDTIIL